MVSRKVFALLIVVVMLSVFIDCPQQQGPSSVKPAYTGTWYQEGESLCGYELKHVCNAREVVVQEAERQSVSDLLVRLAKVGAAATGQHDAQLWYEHDGRWRIRLRSNQSPQWIEQFWLYETGPQQSVIAGLRFHTTPKSTDVDVALHILGMIQQALVPQQGFALVPPQVTKGTRDNQWYIVDPMKTR